MLTEAEGRHREGYGGDGSPAGSWTEVLGAARSWCREIHGGCAVPRSNVEVDVRAQARRSSGGGGPPSLLSCSSVFSPPSPIPAVGEWETLIETLGFRGAELRA